MQVRYSRPPVGYGPLSFVVEGAHRSDIECHDEGRGHYVMRYKPHEPGIYMLNIKFGDEHVTGWCTHTPPEGADKR